MKLRVELDHEADETDLEKAILDLRAELSDAPVDVERASGPTPAPTGSKAGINAGDILVLTGQAIAFEVVADFLVDWVRRRRRGTKMRIEGPKGELLELPGTTPAEVRRLLVAWAESPPTAGSDRRGA